MIAPAALWGSFRTRLIIGAIIWITVGMGVSGVVLSELFRAHVTQQFDDELHGHAAELAALAVVGPDGAPVIQRRLSDPRFLPRQSGYYWQLSSQDGRRLASPSLGGAGLKLANPAPAPGHERHSFIQGPTGELRLVERVVTPPGAQTPLRIAIGSDERLLDAVLARFNQTLALSLMFIALGLICAAGAQIWFGLRPLARVREALAAVRGGQAHSLPEDLPSEVRPLAADLNALLEANSEMLRRARTQAGNLGHALKTPLAILADEAERLRAAGQDEAAGVLATQIERMRRQIDFQMARARAAASRGAPGVACEVGAVLAPVVSALGRLHGARGVTYLIETDLKAMVAMDPLDLSEVLANVLDNAGKWARSRVSISLAQAKDAVRIHIDDDGAGLPPEAWDVVFDIGERLDEQAPGSGLGLAIVRDLVTLYGGRVWLERSPLGGLRASLAVPPAQP